MSCRVWLRQLRAKKQVEDPSFWFQSGGSAFGNWLGAIHFDARARRELGTMTAFGAVQSLWQPAGESWVGPRVLADAAFALLTLLEEHPTETTQLLALYAACAVGPDPRGEMIADLHDVVKMARWATRRGIALVAFRVEAPDRNAPSDLPVDVVYELTASVLGPGLRNLGLQRAPCGWLRYRSREARFDGLNVITDAYANRLLLWSDGREPHALDSQTETTETFGPRTRSLHFGSLEELGDGLNRLATDLPWDLLRSRVLLGCESPIGSIRQLLRSEHAFALYAAGEPGVSDRIRLEIARLDPQLALAVAKSPFTGRDLLARLAEHSDAEVRAASTRRRAGT